MAEEIEIAIRATKDEPKIIEIDAEIIRMIIVRTAYARDKAATKAANQIAEYFAECLRNVATPWRQ